MIEAKFRSLILGVALFFAGQGARAQEEGGKEVIPPLSQFKAKVVARTEKETLDEASKFHLLKRRFLNFHHVNRKKYPNPFFEVSAFIRTEGSFFQEYEISAVTMDKLIYETVPNVFPFSSLATKEKELLKLSQLHVQQNLLNLNTTRLLEAPCSRPHELLVVLDMLNRQMEKIAMMKEENLHGQAMAFRAFKLMLRKYQNRMMDHHKNGYKAFDGGDLIPVFLYHFQMLAQFNVNLATFRDGLKIRTQNFGAKFPNEMEENFSRSLEATEGFLSKNIYIEKNFGEVIAKSVDRKVLEKLRDDFFAKARQWEDQADSLQADEMANNGLLIDQFLSR